MQRFNTIESLTEVVGDGYFRNIPKGKIIFEKEKMFQVILNEAVIMVINENNESKYLLFSGNSEARRIFKSL